ncbi:DUF4349 domain-containing protein [Streptosporangium sp. NPDC002524]|uniref:DUF4349 domain-containing protein n=1 Tax=Streptosporangium sp. NPDC002524 TaxID=3154537 RepID=UPI00332079D6
MSRFRYGPRLAIPLVGLALLVSACASNEVQSTSDLAAPAPAAESNAGGSGVRAPEADSASRQAAGKDAASPDSQNTAQVRVVPEDRAIVYTAEMTVRAKDVTAAADRARQIVTTAGGYLARERSDAHSDGEGSATLVFKIPPGNYPGTLDRLGRDLGTRESLQQNTKDVTEQVADVESRLKSAKAALDSLRTLLKRANTIGEVLEVEREVSNRESELESLQARQRTLASQTSMATLTLNLVGPAAVVQEPDDEPSGFFGGLETGWKAFVSAAKIGLTLLGVLLPWLVLIGLVWLVLAFLLRLRRGGRDERGGPGGPGWRGDRPLAPPPADPDPAPVENEEDAEDEKAEDDDADEGPVPMSPRRGGTPAG